MYTDTETHYSWTVSHASQTLSGLHDRIRQGAFFLCMIRFCTIRYVFVLCDTFLYVSRRFYGFCTIGFFPNKYIYCRVFNGYEWHKFKEIYVYWQSKIWNVLNDGLINKNLPDNVPVCGNGPTTTNVNLPVKAVN